MNRADFLKSIAAIGLLPKELRLPDAGPAPTSVAPDGEVAVGDKVRATFDGVPFDVHEIIQRREAVDVTSDTDHANRVFMHGLVTINVVGQWGISPDLGHFGELSIDMGTYVLHGNATVVAVPFSPARAAVLSLAGSLVVARS